MFTSEDVGYLDCKNGKLWKQKQYSCVLNVKIWPNHLYVKSDDKSKSLKYAITNFSQNFTVRYGLCITEI